MNLDNWPTKNVIANRSYVTALLFLSLAVVALVNSVELAFYIFASATAILLLTSIYFGGSKR